MKKFFAVLFTTWFAATSLFAQVTVSGPISAATTTQIFTGPGSILAAQVFDTSAAANAMVMYDLGSTSSTNLVRPSYTAGIQYLTNRVTSYTTPLGTTVNITNQVLFNGTTTVAATTNEANRVFYSIIPASGSFVASDATLPAGVSRGLVVRTVGAATYSVTYVPQL